MVFGLSRSHEKLKDFPAALRYIEKFTSYSGLFFETDKEYRLAYWSTLLAEGNCYQQCQNHVSAAKCFRDILDQEVLDERWAGSVHTEALSGLFTTWTETKSYCSIVEFMRSWKDGKNKKRDVTYWFQRTTAADKIHGYIIVAAKNAEAVEEICLLYQEAIDHMASSSSTADEQGDGFDPNARPLLQYFQAALRFHGSQSQHNHDRGIQSWEEIVRRSDDPSSSWWTAYKASRELAPCLLDKAISESAAVSSNSSESYASKLKTLARMNNSVIRIYRQGQFDPRLCLTRLYCLKGDHESAFAEAQERLCSVFDNWPEDTNDDSLTLRFENLAQTLTVLDKDANAIAAWQATIPPKSRKPSLADVIVPEAGQATDPNHDVVQPSSLPMTNGDQTEAAHDTAVSANDTPKAYVSSRHCDGDCGTSWKDMLADCWVCKHCLDRQLCPRCYEKLQADEFHPLVCNKDHKHLYLPAFDQEMWQSTSADMMIVDKQPVPRLQWLNKIQDEYGVQQEQIDMLKVQKARELKAAGCIALHVSKWRRKFLKNRTAKQHTVPTLRRAKTIM